MKRNVLIGGIAAALVVILAWYFILYKPLGDDLSSAKSQVETEQKRMQDLEATLAQLQSQEKNAARQQALLSRLDRAIPKQPDLGQFIVTANDIADSAGIEFLSIAPSPPAAGTGVSTISLTITISGSFFQLQDYLRQLENIDRLVVIDGFNVSAGSASGSTADTSSASSDGGTTLNVSLTGRMFTRAAPAATPGGTTTPGAATTPTTTAPGAATSTTTAPAGSTTGGT